MHLKRMAAPKSWNLLRKEKKYIVKPLPGKHSLKNCLSIAHALKSIGLASETRSLKKSLNVNPVIIDGVPVKEYKQQAGLFDTIQTTGKKYRVVMTKGGMLTIKESKGTLKPCRVERKITTKGGKTQIGLSDGRTIIWGEGDVKTGDSLLLEVPSQKIKGHSKIEKGAKILVLSGKSAGVTGIITEINDKIVKYSSENTTSSTSKDNIFVIPEGFEE